MKSYDSTEIAHEKGVLKSPEANTEIKCIFRKKMIELLFSDKGKKALAAAAIGAFAVGAVAWGVVAIGKMAVGSAHFNNMSIKNLKIDHLKVKYLEVEEQI